MREFSILRSTYRNVAASELAAARALVAADLTLITNTERGRIGMRPTCTLLSASAVVLDGGADTDELGVRQHDVPADLALVDRYRKHLCHHSVVYSLSTTTVGPSLSTDMTAPHIFFTEIAGYGTSPWHYNLESRVSCNGDFHFLIALGHTDIGCSILFLV